MKIDIEVLQRAVKNYINTLEQHKANPLNAEALHIWDAADAELSSVINNDETNIIISLLEQLEAAQKENGVVRNKYESMSTAYSSVTAELAKAEAELSAANEKLSKPVEFPDCDIGAVSHIAHWYSEKQCEVWVAGVEFSKKQIIKAGFTVKGE